MNEDRLRKLGEAFDARFKSENYLRKASKKSRLTYSMIAKVLGLAQSYVSNVHHGKVAPGYLQVELLAAFYGMEMPRELRTLDPDTMKEIRRRAQE